MEQNIMLQILEGSMKPTDLPFETLRSITDDFSVDRIIGEGGFGTVYKGVVGNRNFAVKRIKSSMTIDQKLFRREVDSLMEVNHKNVVQFIGLCSHTVETPMKNPESRGYIYVEIRERLLCFQYIGNGSLDTVIVDELRGLDWDKRYQVIKGICAGLHYLHTEKHILHMDLKPANILLDYQMVPKITDFGLSRPTKNSHTISTTHFSSPGYGAPENMFGQGRMSVNSDMYSLGVIIIELVTGHKGIPGDNNNILRRWRHRWNKLGKETPLEYHQQVTGCLEIGSLCQKIDPYARPSISEIMSRFVEMERTDNHRRNANELTVGQVNPFNWEDDMLGVEPLELQFAYNEKKHIFSCSVELSNDTDGFIAFKIQTNSPLPYSIEPNKGITKPRSKCSVDITLPAANTQNHKDSASNKQYTKVFIVQSIKVNQGLTSENIDQDIFDKHRVGHNVDEMDLSVVFSSKGNLSEETSSFQTTLRAGASLGNEFSFPSLYWHHIFSGSNQNQSTILKQDDANGFGTTLVNDWTIFDGPGDDAKVVARAQGLHIQAGNWHNTFTIVFETERFSGSTLQVMGVSVGKEEDWSIVGGTGQFAMARGVIYKNILKQIGGGDLIQLAIHGYSPAVKWSKA